MTTNNVNQIQLNTGATIPQVGFGTFQINPATTQKAVEEALELGYRHIDTATAYYNEAGVGAALKASGLARDEVFITTKLRNFDQSPDTARSALEKSLEALGLDHLDLYLIHWPVPSKDLYVPTWKVITDAADEGLITSPGVSNFLVDHLTRILDETGRTPAVNQIEVHPSFSQKALREFCAAHNIVVEAYSPLGQGADLSDPVVTGIADRLGVTPAQVVLAWHIQRGTVVIPKSVNPERMAANLAAADVTLTDADLAAIDALDRADGRIGGDPAVFDWPQTQEDAAARGEGV